jgi:hypothetical protein
LARTKNNGPFAGIRELLKNVGYVKWMYYYVETGILEIVLAARVVITSRIIEGMEKSGLILESISLSVAPEFIDSLGDFLSDIQDEDDVPEFICTTMRFKDTELPPVENSDTGAPRRDPLDAEFVAMIRDSARSSCEADTDEQQGDGDDIADE